MNAGWTKTIVRTKQVDYNELFTRLDIIRLDINLLRTS